MKLSKAQKDTLFILQQYPNEMVMYDGWLTGGHGVKLNLNTIRSLKNKGLINRWGDYRDRISDLGKELKITY